MLRSFRLDACSINIRGGRSSTYRARTRKSYSENGWARSGGTRPAYGTTVCIAQEPRPEHQVWEARRGAQTTNMLMVYETPRHVATHKVNVRMPAQSEPGHYRECTLERSTTHQSSFLWAASVQRAALTEPTRGGRVRTRSARSSRLLHTPWGREPRCRRARSVLAVGQRHHWSIAECTVPNRWSRLVCARTQASPSERTVIVFIVIRRIVIPACRPE